MEKRFERFYRDSYCIRGVKDRPIYPYQLRDGDAFAELQALLAFRGLHYAGLLCNFPPAEPPDLYKLERRSVTWPVWRGDPLLQKLYPEIFRKVDLSFGPSDLLVLTTRPPLDDERLQDRRRVEASYTTFEEQLFVALRRYFEICARSRIRLTPALAAHLEPGYRNRADAEFRMHKGAWYKAYRAYYAETWEKQPGSNATAAYLLYTDAIWEGGPGLLASFGMGGTETLVWNHLLRTTELADLLNAPVFVMAEIERDPEPAQPMTLDFARDWKIKIVLKHALAPSRAPVEEEPVLAA